MTKCTVCHTPLREMDAPAKSTHEHVAYYFCSEKCEKTFEANRQKYIQKPVQRREFVGV